MNCPSRREHAVPTSMDEENDKMKGGFSLSAFSATGKGVRRALRRIGIGPNSQSAVLGARPAERSKRVPTLKLAGLRVSSISSQSFDFNLATLGQNTEFPSSFAASIRSPGASGIQVESEGIPFLLWP